MKRLILTPNRTEMCGMYQLAKDLAKDHDDIKTKTDNIEWFLQNKQYDEVITFLYPMHKWGKRAKELGIKWICYNQGIPPIMKVTFPNFFRRQYMKIFNILNEKSMHGADEYWFVTTTPQKPRWTEKIDEVFHFQGYCNFYFNQMLNKSNKGEMEQSDFKYALYVGRKTDYKNFQWLNRTMHELEIPFVCPPEDCSDEVIHSYYSGASIFVTASLWEGYGRPVMEAEALGIPAVAYGVGAHRKHIKKGICVECFDENAFKKAVETVWRRECQQ